MALAPASFSCNAPALLLPALEPWGGGVTFPTLPVLPPLAPRSRAYAGPGNCRCGRLSAFPPAARVQCSGGGGVSAASWPGVGTRQPCPRFGPVPRSRGPFPAQGPAAGAGRAYSMEVCYQLPVLPLDRPVPQHVLSRRGAISFSSSSALFGCPNPRQLSQVNCRRRGRSHLGLLSLFPSSHPASPPGQPQSSPFTQTIALFIVWDFLGCPFDLRALSFILRAVHSLFLASSGVGSRSLCLYSVSPSILAQRFKPQ